MVDFESFTEEYYYNVNAVKSQNELGATGNWSVITMKGKSPQCRLTLSADDDLHFIGYNFNKNSKSNKKLEILISKNCLFYNAMKKLFKKDGKDLIIASDFEKNTTITITETANGILFYFENEGGQTKTVSIKNRCEDIRSFLDYKDVVENSPENIPVNKKTTKQRILSCCSEMTNVAIKQLGQSQPNAKNEFLEL
ncbi:MAG: hypothetical protein PHI76_03710 [Clostridia bacterium]|nr:hypothetical protein [Clostridia bacterium]